MHGVRVAAVTLAVGVCALVGLACAGEQAGPTEDIVSAIPWSIGEECSYSILDSDGEWRGSGVLRIEGENGRLRLVQHYQSVEFDDRSSLVVDNKTLKPISGERVISGEEGELRIEVRYTNGTVEVERTATEDSKQEHRTDTLAVPEHAYDWASSLFLWRTVALRHDYEASYFNMATSVVRKPQRIRVTVRVVGQETVEVPAGIFRTWRLEIRSSGTKQTAWYDTGGTHPLVKYDSGDVGFLLESIKKGRD
ncbi:MAG: DUF3108 domain-containing protein [Dehalococcoidia bacterium]